MNLEKVVCKFEIFLVACAGIILINSCEKENLNKYIPDKTPSDKHYQFLLDSIYNEINNSKNHINVQKSLNSLIFDNSYKP